LDLIADLAVSSADIRSCVDDTEEDADCCRDFVIELAGPMENAVAVAAQATRAERARTLGENFILLYFFGQLIISFMDVWASRGGINRVLVPVVSQQRWLIEENCLRWYRTAAIRSSRSRKKKVHRGVA
jgi:hypothetical protein